MRKLIVLYLVCVLCVLAVSRSQQVKAGGFPVVDISHIAQSITSYLAQLEDYQEQLNQLGVMDNQYLQMLIEYEQTLQEYSHYLNQITGLANTISSADWESLLRQTLAYYGRGDFSTIPTLRVTTPTFSQDLDTILRQVHHLPREPEVVKTDIQALTGQVPSASFEQGLQYNYQRYDKYKDVQAMVAQNADDGLMRRELIDRYAIRVQSLGDESDLATMQLMASQNQLLFDQLEANNQILNQILQQQGTEEAERAARKAAMIDKEIARLERVTSRTTPLLGQDRWGDF